MDGFEQDCAGLLPYDTLDHSQQRSVSFHNHVPTWPPLDIMSHNNNAAHNPQDSTQTSSHLRSQSMATMATTAPTQASFLQTSGLAYPHQALDPSAALQLTTAEWQFQLQQQPSQQAYNPDPNLDMSSLAGTYGAQLQSSPIEDFMPTTQEQLNNSLASSYIPFTSSVGQMNNMAFQMQDFHNELMNNMSNTYDGVHTTDYVASVPSSIPNSSPGELWLDARSLSNHSDNGWTMIGEFPQRQSFDSFNNSFANELIVSPQHLQHHRSDSDSSQHSEIPLSATLSNHSWEEIPFPISPEPEATMDFGQPLVNHGLPLSHHDHDHHNCSPMQHSPIMSSTVQALPIQPSTSSSSVPSPVSSGAGSPTTKRRKSPPAPVPGVSSKAITKKKPATSPTNKEGKPEKKVGKRRGPLRPEQRQQAHEIRKLRACLRCKFLKKVCDKGDPCGGCQPSHTRLWQVPCTRIDIKELAYFLKDWNADYERHVTLGFSVANIKGFSAGERQIYITHGYGFYLPISAREVYVRDEKCFGVDWVEQVKNPRAFDLNTAKLSAGMEGVSHAILSEYLDKHIDGGFEHFVDEYFEGTAFLTDILKTVYRYYLHSKLPVIRKALKLVVAYALTLHITMVSGLSDEEMQCGKVEDENSRYCGQTVAPVMINFQVKKSMADLWRELMKEILEELSALFSSVYSGEKHKNWPTIFMLAAIILLVWELMQFDCHYRIPDQGAVTKFCNDMESTPVGVIVGLFSAISTKLPSFLEWDTNKHHHLLNSNPAVCDAMTEVRNHVERHEPYLKTRNECKFDRNDFDSLSNKFLSKLVIRAN